jgi:zinc/manganese transport system substrate-binding protein
MLGKCLAAFGILTWLVAAGLAHAQDKVRVVATFSILADLAKNVGGDAVEVASLVGPNGDAHAYAPSPTDAKLLADAKLVLVNGLGFEGWIDRLVKASGTKAQVVAASKGVKPRHAKGEPGHGHGHDHGTNASAYLAKLDALDREVKATIAAIPAARRKIITTHDAFGYFAAAYGVQFIAPQGVSTEAEVSARDLARIIRQVKAQKIPAVFMENVTDPRLMRRIAEETGAKVGGKLYSDALSEPSGPAPTYIDMMKNNLKEFTAALAG